jgi:uncharacterized membrane protein
MFVIDRSESIGKMGRLAAEEYVREALEKRGDAQIGVVGFDGAAEIEQGLGRPARDVEEGSEAELDRNATPGTDIAAAIRLAAAALPSSGQRRIVVLSDGRATRGDALAEVRLATRAGIVVDTVPIGETESRLTVTKVTARQDRLADGEPATMVADLRGKPNERVVVQWTKDEDESVFTTVAQLDADGNGSAVFTDSKPGPGAHVYHARLAGSLGAERGGHGRAAVDVVGKPRALVVSLDSQCPGVLAAAIDEAGVERALHVLGQTKLDAAALSAADLVVLADVPLAPAGSGSDAGGLSREGQEAIIEFAQKGGGVLVTGGPFGFAPEYADTPLARMLPVEIENQGQMEDPRVAMAIMLDRSGSMAARVGTHTKIQLAVEASLAAATTLRPDDVLALGSVDTKTNWDHPLGPVSGLAARRDAIRSIEAGGGGIYVYTALVDAYAALARASAPVRHVILFADTADAEQQTEECPGGCPHAKTSGELAETARKAGITTSVVGIGRETDSDTAFLRKLAASGGGRFYITGNGVDLRRIFVSEARVATRSNLREGPIAVTASENHPILAGVDVASFPPLGGFVETRRRATADTALETQGDPRPILASWRYGLGKVVALTTDLRGDWKNGWSTYAQAGQVLRQAVRFAIRRHGTNAADMRVAVGHRDASLTLDLGEGPGDPAPSSIEAFAFDESGHTEPVRATLERVAPGRYAATLASGGKSFVVARVRDASGAVLGEALGQADASEELAALGPDERALRDLAGAGSGVFDPEPRTAMRASGPRGREPMPLWPWMLVLAATLVTIDLWVRRIGRRAAIALPVAVATPPVVEQEAPRAAA